MTNNPNHQHRHCIIAGVYKTGTSSLFRYLADHPDVSPSIVKETGFFIDHSSYSDYLKLFDGASSEKYLMEASTGYFSSSQALTNITDNLPSDTQIIIVLRNPHDRFLSYFKYYQNNYKHRAGAEQFEFETIDDYFHLCKNTKDKSGPVVTQLEEGSYLSHIQKWKHAFDSNLHIVFFEHLESNPKDVMLKLSKQLEIDEKFYNNYQFGIHNQTISYRNASLQKLAVLVHQKLEPFFRKHPKLKDSMRDLYYLVNRSSRPPTTSNAESNNIIDYYGKPNRDLRAFLLSNMNLQADDLPDWLDDTSQ